MNPWYILGWLFVVGILFVVLGRLILLSISLFDSLRELVRARVKHLQTRAIPPAKGQIWNQNGRRLEITNLHDNGVIGIRCGNASWGDSRDGWKERVENRKLFLVSAPSLEPKGTSADNASSKP